MLNIATLLIFFSRKLYFRQRERRELCSIHNTRLRRRNRTGFFRKHENSSPYSNINIQCHESCSWRTSMGIRYHIKIHNHEWAFVFNTIHKLLCRKKNRKYMWTNELFSKEVKLLTTNFLANKIMYACNEHSSLSYHYHFFSTFLYCQISYDHIMMIIMIILLRTKKKKA